MTSVTHVGSHSVNCNCSVFLPYLESFYSSDLTIVRVDRNMYSLP